MQRQVGLRRSDIGSILRSVDLGAQQFTVHQEKTLRALSLCRTAALGGHVDACDDCGNVSISYNSCRNRHCPKCQGHHREAWIQAREHELLPCTYYHVVFTLPQALHSLSLHAPRIIYRLLFEAAWATLSQFGKHEAVQLGMIAILHTWGQQLSLHPHIHCIVPGGGVTAKGEWQSKVRSNQYLFSVKAMSKVFRAKYVSLLRASGVGNEPLYQSLFKHDWVVYAKRPFGGPKQVIAYLGRYTHKVAISNQRIESVDDTGVRLKYKDYRNGGVTKTMLLSTKEFIRRFSMHILPSRFVRIRHYGILSSSWKRGRLRDLQTRLYVAVKPKIIETLHRTCRCCKVGNLVTIAVFGERGPPELYKVENIPVPIN